MKHLQELYESHAEGLTTLFNALYQENLFEEEFYKLKYCITVVYMVPRA